MQATLSGIVLRKNSMSETLTEVEVNACSAATAGTKEE
jgi:hypothetical protein